MAKFFFPLIVISWDTQMLEWQPGLLWTDALLPVCEIAQLGDLSKQPEQLMAYWSMESQSEKHS